MILKLFQMSGCVLMVLLLSFLFFGIPSKDLPFYHYRFLIESCLAMGLYWYVFDRLEA